MVVGCGALGAASALALDRAGHDVTVVERIGPANTYGSSARRGADLPLRPTTSPTTSSSPAARSPRWRAIEAAGGSGPADDDRLRRPRRRGVGRRRCATAGGRRRDARPRGGRSPLARPALRRRRRCYDPAGGRLDAAARGAGDGPARGRRRRDARAPSGRSRSTPSAVGTGGRDLRGRRGRGHRRRAGRPRSSTGFPPPVVTLEQPLHLASAAPTTGRRSSITPRASPFVYGLLRAGRGAEGRRARHRPRRRPRRPRPHAGPRARRAPARVRRRAGCRAPTPRPPAPPAASTTRRPPTTSSSTACPRGVVVAAGTSGHGFKFAHASSAALGRPRLVVRARPAASALRACA